MITTDTPMRELHAAKAAHDALEEEWIAADNDHANFWVKAAISDKMAALDPVIAELENDRRAFILHQLKPWGFTAAHIRELFL